MNHLLVNDIRRLGAVMLTAVPGRFDTKSRGWAWKTPDVPPWLARAVARKEVIYEDAASANDIYLTFDCDVETGQTSRFIDTLRAENVKAAFFITGSYLDRNAEMVRRMLADGHIIGNHSHSHPNFPELSVHRMRAEVLDLERSFQNLCGRRMTYFRPPSGEYCERSLAVVSALGYKTVFWTLAYKDWDPSWRRGEAFAYDMVMQHVRPGVIVMLHTVSEDNAEALARVIRDLKAKRYRFRSLDELGAGNPAEVD